MSETRHYTTHNSTIGQLLLIAGSSGLEYLTLLGKHETPAMRFPKAMQVTPTERPEFFATTCRAIDDYFAGRSSLNVPTYVTDGTPLQRAVWQEIARIPYGQTISYTHLAQQVGVPKAVRAVASACGANPLPLVIPCHRVIAKDGSLGGFSLGGLHVKQWLLALEQRRETRAAA